MRLAHNKLLSSVTGLHQSLQWQCGSICPSSDFFFPPLCDTDLMASNECEEQKAAWCRILFPSPSPDDPKAADLHASCIQTSATSHQRCHDNKEKKSYCSVLHCIIHVRRLSHFQCPQQQLGLIPRTGTLCSEVEVREELKTRACVCLLFAGVFSNLHESCTRFNWTDSHVRVFFSTPA